MSRRITARAQADASAEIVWRLIAAPQRWPAWGPSIRAVCCDDAILRPGSRGRVQLSFGPWLPFVVRRCEPPHYWDWSVAGIPATGHRVVPLGPARCQVAFELPVAAAPYWFVCRLAAARVARLAERAVAEGAAT